MRLTTFIPCLVPCGPHVGRPLSECEAAVTPTEADGAASPTERGTAVDGGVERYVRQISQVKRMAAAARSAATAAEAQLAMLLRLINPSEVEGGSSSQRPTPRKALALPHPRSNT